jgi:hypothetical protein
MGHRTASKGTVELAVKKKNVAREAAKTEPTRMVGEMETGAYWRTSDRVLWGALPLCPQAQSGGLFRCSKWNRSNSSAGRCSLTDCRFARAFADSVIHESPFARRSRTPCRALTLFALILAYSIIRGHFSTDGLRLVCVINLQRIC